MHAFGCGLFRREVLLFNDPHTVFHHDDRIVHQRTDHQNQREHRQNVHRETERHEEDERADQGDRDCGGRNQRCTPVLQEDVGNGNHEQEGDDQSFDNLLHRGADVFGRVIAHDVAHTLRETLGELFQLGIRFGDDVVCVRVVVAVDCQSDGGLAVEHTVVGIILRTEFNAGDVRQARHDAVFPDLDDDVLELLRSFQTAEGVDFQLNVFVAVFRADRSGGRLDVLILNRGGNVRRLDVERGHAERIEPDAHAVGTLAEDLARRYAVDTREFIADVDFDVVAELKQVQLGTVGRECVHAENIGGTLDGLHAERLDFRGERGLRALHGVLDVDLRNIGIGSGFEGNRKLIIAAVVRRRAEVDHIFDTVDFRFDDGSDGIRDNFSAGARVGGGNHNLRRCDFRIFRDRNVRDAHRAQKHGDERDHDRQLGSVNKDL